MAKLFYKCFSLIELDLTNIYTNLVTNMEYMFYQCWSLKSLNLTNFNTSSVINISYMFYDCYSLIILIVDEFITEKLFSSNSKIFTLKKLQFSKCYFDNNDTFYSFTRSGTTIGLVFRSIVPQLRPRPKEEPRIVVSSFLSLSAIRVTISDGMLAPPRLPNSSRL